VKKPIPFGKYYLLERINVGGMAEVFRAKAYGVEGFERLVAVKRILPNIAEDKEFIGMFIDEAKIAVQLNHANIAQIFDLGMVDSSYYIALEHIHGRDLRAIFDRCREQGQAMPIAQAAFVIMKVCEGLDYAHNKRDQSGRELHLVHRDVSPQNVLVSFEGEIKLIDFGIAKAAGKGAKTQAGILKGKFGYMSPEQVRGLPIDRRTDIFSCGIVLYELLTGERLFVGESDFSTLEKVRNVEILPPSTYNRKIPDELERIVLKALAKDMEDRYQNAIDLHDDLQAFVYTAGEFYSRKDLAAWMKETFTREIEDETAKLESYRQLRPPEMRTPSARRTPPPAVQTPRRATLAMPSVAPKPPPIPPSADSRKGGRSATPTPAGTPAVAQAAMAAGKDQGLAWDDDELETKIYDSHDGHKPPEQGVTVKGSRSGRGFPDETLPLGSLTDSLGPGAPVAPAPPAAGAGAKPGQIAGPAAQAQTQTQTARGWDSGPQAPPPAKFPAGSNQSPSPFADDDTGLMAAVRQLDEAPTISPFDTIAPGEARPRHQPRTGLYMGIAAALLLVISGGIGSYLLFQKGDDSQAAAATTSGDEHADGIAADTQVDGAAQDMADQATEATGNQGGASPTGGLSKEILAQTGFNLIVEPKEATVELDGEELKLTPPMKVRNIQPGEHELLINGPPGFFSKNQTITVEAGKADLITIKLDPLEIAATFTSDPAGADVTLIVNKDREVSLGVAPITRKLDPRNSYEVRFSKRGFLPKTASVPISGRSEESVVAVLERAPRSGAGDAKINRNTGTGAVKTGGSDSGKGEGDRSGEGDKSGASSGATETGTLMLSSKPPCQIFIAGKDTGKSTPQRELILPAGRHKITLINNEFGINESFTVTIKAGQTVKEVKDLTDRIAQ
jgi:eukaryotic-like serine/threonine-protein kinase